MAKKKIDETKTIKMFFEITIKPKILLKESRASSKCTMRNKIFKKWLNSDAGNRPINSRHVRERLRMKIPIIKFIFSLCKGKGFVEY